MMIENINTKLQLSEMSPLPKKNSIISHFKTSIIKNFLKKKISSIITIIF